MDHPRALGIPVRPSHDHALEPAPAPHPVPVYVRFHSAHNNVHRRMGLGRRGLQGAAGADVQLREGRRNRHCCRWRRRMPRHCPRSPRSQLAGHERRTLRQVPNPSPRRPAGAGDGHDGVDRAQRAAACLLPPHLRSGGRQRLERTLPTRRHVGRRLQPAAGRADLLHRRPSLPLRPHCLCAWRRRCATVLHHQEPPGARLHLLLPGAPRPPRRERP
mmetsp:Transcript_19378/g.74419  ORF Transcript_19378/g.74419 Transcript_19378/m.74419 type:complete len:217 (+) Transcript_19378:119-769(+)